MKPHILLYKGDGIGPELFESLRAFFCLFEDFVEFRYIQHLSDITAAAPVYVLCGPLKEETPIAELLYKQPDVSILSVIPSIHPRKNKHKEIRILSSPNIGSIHKQPEIPIHAFDTKNTIVLLHQSKEHPEIWEETMKSWARLAFSDNSIQLEDQNLYSFIRHGEYRRVSQIVSSAEIEKVITALYISEHHAQNYSYKQIKAGKSILTMPLHGHAPDITGMGIANPLAIILAFSGLLKEINYVEIAQNIDNQIENALKIDSERITPDMGGILNTEKYIAMIVECINL